MYKILLCWRYLRTRWIALASIVSVTLGVATLIVVNSVMDGFTTEMHDRIHGILSDVVVRSHATHGITEPDRYRDEIQHRLGNRLEGITTVVAVPAMLTYTFRGQTQTQQINLIGIDTDTYASVSHFRQYLLHPKNREKLEFLLRDSGYAPERPQLRDAGWGYRKTRAKELEAQARYEEAIARNKQLQQQIASIPAMGTTSEPIATTTSTSPNNLPSNAEAPQDAATPTTPLLPLTPGDVAGTTPMVVPTEPQTAPTLGAMPSIQPTSDSVGSFHFNPAVDVHTGIVLGIGTGSIRNRNLDGKVEDFFFIRPGDDVSVTFPNAGTPPRAVDTMFTVVDFYESKMSEYDSTFCFVPLASLQKLRGMIDPASGVGAVTSFQIKLKPGVSIEQARDDLREAFPPSVEMVMVESWKDSQGPLLAAVQLETTLLNILLFMIIAVAGFGILATFFMIVVEKTRDIGVLKSLGASGKGIATIFLGYGTLLGAVGSGVGAILGLLFVWNINSIAKLVEVITGREVFDPTVYYFNTIPTVIHPLMVVWVVIGAMTIAILASVLPSIRAARMHPVEALRYE